APLVPPAPTSPTGAAGVSLIRAGTATGGAASEGTTAGGTAAGFVANTSSVAGGEPELRQPADTPSERKQLENDCRQHEDIYAQLNPSAFRVRRELHREMSRLPQIGAMSRCTHRRPRPVMPKWMWQTSALRHTVRFWFGGPGRRSARCRRLRSAGCRRRSSSCCCPRRASSTRADATRDARLPAPTAERRAQRLLP